ARDALEDGRMDRTRRVPDLEDDRRHGTGKDPGPRSRLLPRRPRREPVHGERRWAADLSRTRSFHRRRPVLHVRFDGVAHRSHVVRQVDGRRPGHRHHRAIALTRPAATPCRLRICARQPRGARALSLRRQAVAAREPLRRVERGRPGTRDDVRGQPGPARHPLSRAAASWTTWLWPHSGLQHIYKRQCAAFLLLLIASTGVYMKFGSVVPFRLSSVLAPIVGVVIYRHGARRTGARGRLEVPIWQRSSVLLVLVCMVVIPSAALFRLALSHEFAKLVLTERSWIETQADDLLRAAGVEAFEERY